MKAFIPFFIVSVAGYALAAESRCPLSVTTATGTAVNKNGKYSRHGVADMYSATPSSPQGGFCSGELIFEDNFNSLDQSKWQHEVTLAGGGNWEFQWYVNDRTNSYTQNGVLHLRPTLTSDIYGEAFLTSGTIKLGAECTNADFWGCERTGSPNNVLNPIRSARLRTLNSFSFKYGRVEVRAKLPAGDWLWPAIWMLPSKSAYGGWPRSGEIDIMESRGNRNFVANGVPIGAEQMGSTLHFGPDPSVNGWPTAHYDKNTSPGQGYNLDFHRYQLEWAPDHFTFKIDDVQIGTVWVGSGFWDRGDFSKISPWYKNPWQTGKTDAPFDQEFHLLINLAVGGVAYFPDGVWNPDPKPWSNNSPQASTDFWNGREAWLKTWNYNVPGNTESHMQVDYVRVWAL